ncbi:hypothetical protein jhhlp_000847 [Lomentospora prolificans]|uniref:FAD-binding FR-type domain-containing protein n=1 Tax=Lomentospora prolificans TaxID=41688 RepID=A0A2N3NJM0_9PEZI|nr:hypothetical protein jhhlp_000847 [Lomentospora prolificans]
MDHILRTGVSPRHIQDFTQAKDTEPHWGYADRVVPCVNDPGSCAYLDEVYAAHDLGMIYIGVFWLTIVAILTVWGAVHWRSKLSGDKARLNTTSSAEQARTVSVQPTSTRLKRAALASIRRHLLPEAFFPFGRASRLQVTILGILCAYLTIWTFLGIGYRKWVTPVASSPGYYNTRTSLGPWSDRIGVLAYALTPLSVLLSTRESFLSVVTGVPYQNFNFLHRWLGYVIVVQSSLHTIGWCIVEIRLYQPQPMVADMWIKQLYIIWGVVAMILLLLLYVLSLPPVIRLTGYEFFRKSHYVLAMVYIGACIGHWEQLHCFLTPSIIIWALDRLARAVRTILLHRAKGSSSLFSIVPAKADAVLFPNDADGDVVRLHFSMESAPWQIGQHFYLCFPESSIWQSHPMTSLSHPGQIDGRVTHSYVMRAKSGETKKIAELVAKKLAAGAGSGSEKSSGSSRSGAEVSVLLTGPYGEHLAEQLTSTNNVLCVAGGTGITYVLPVLLELAKSNLSNRKVDLIWVIRRSKDVAWIEPELQILRGNPDITIRILVTREDETHNSISTSSIEKMIDEKEMGVEKSINTGATQLALVGGENQPAEKRHPDLIKCVNDFVEGTTSGRTVVFGSGPVGMISDLRKAVAALNSGSRVWKGEERYDVTLCYDERLER